jgi:hypothetical protein
MYTYLTEISGEKALTELQSILFPATGFVPEAAIGDDLHETILTLWRSRFKYQDFALGLKRGKKCYFAPYHVGILQSLDPETDTRVVRLSFSSSIPSGQVVLASDLAEIEADLRINSTLSASDLDRLEIIYKESTQATAHYCSANEEEGGCSCKIFYLTPDLGFGTYNVEDTELTEPDRNGDRLERVTLGKTSQIPHKDIKCFAEAKNALPALIKLARDGLAFRKTLERIAECEEATDAYDGITEAVELACKALGRPKPTFGAK